MVLKNLQIQRRNSYDSNPGGLYGTITITGSSGNQEINLSAQAMLAIVKTVQLEVINATKRLAKDTRIAFQNTSGELELLEHPLAQIEE